MKIAILCDSLLLKNSLEIFLKDYICSYKNCDIVISDKKIDTDKLLVIISSDSNADIKKPFSKSSLLMDLKKIYNQKENDKNDQTKKPDKKKDKKNKKDLWLLTRKIDKLTLDFRENLIDLIKEFYEK